MNTKRIFIPGDEWLYYKIYCGARTSDLILTETLYPFIQSLIHKGWIDHWFFIRYADPDFHIRIRLHCPDPANLGNCMIGIKNVLQSYVDDDVIYKVQQDTYIRELERYGNENINASEQLFWKESEMLVQGRALVEDDTLYVLFILKAIDLLLTGFGYDNTEKLTITTANRQGFWNEFNGNKELTKQLDQKYRGLKDTLFSFLTPGQENPEYQELYDILNHKISVTQQVTEAVEQYLETPNAIVSKHHLLASYIHMLVNRAFRSKQRFYELVCYDFLMKYYKSIKYRK